ncbi:MAG: phosphotransferase [Chthonomonadales bacterium]|nr:phosphotransferase [Chthonomonadales bacterium]
MRRDLTAEEIAAVLALYDVGRPTGAVASGGGTANANAVVETPAGRFFLKRRNPKYARPEYVAFDHRLMEHLAARRVGTPLACPTSAGERWLTLDGAVYELYPFVAGEPHDRRSLAQIAAAGTALAAYHRAVRDFAPPPGKAWPRYRDPRAIRSGLDAVRGEVQALLAPADTRYLEAQVTLLERGLSDARYAALPRTVVHGDYHPGNLKFAADRVVGIFDLDWATVQPRVLDLADGTVLFAGVRDSDIDDADIVSLTQTWRPSAERTRAFVEAYLAGQPLAAEEHEALPLFVRALWLSCRVEGMAKVAVERRAPYLVEGLLEPLRRLDAMEKGS